MNRLYLRSSRSQNLEQASHLHQMILPFGGKSTVLLFFSVLQCGTSNLAFCRCPSSRIGDAQRHNVRRIYHLGHFRCEIEICIARSNLFLDGGWLYTIDLAKQYAENLNFLTLDSITPVSIDSMIRKMALVDNSCIAIISGKVQVECGSTFDGVSQTIASTSWRLIPSQPLIETKRGQ